MKFGLSDKQLWEIISKLAEIPDIEEAVFLGSRVIGTCKAVSDVDIALKGPTVKAALQCKTSPIYGRVANEESRLLSLFFVHIFNESI
jgi:hypothetical protein